MKKLLPLVGAFIFSTCSFAGVDTTQLSSAIESGFQSHLNNSGKFLSIVYSGKDISRSTIAVADENTVAIRPSLIG